MERSLRTHYVPTTYSLHTATLIRYATLRNATQRNATQRSCGCKEQHYATQRCGTRYAALRYAIPYMPAPALLCIGRPRTRFADQHCAAPATCCGAGASRSLRRLRNVAGPPPPGETPCTEQRGRAWPLCLFGEARGQGATLTPKKAALCSYRRRTIAGARVCWRLRWRQCLRCQQRSSRFSGLSRAPMLWRALPCSPLFRVSVALPCLPC